MPEVKFIADHKVKQGDGNGPHYKVGEVHDLELSYAEKYKRIGKAVDHVRPPVVVAPVAKPAPAPAPTVAVPPVSDRPRAPFQPQGKRDK